MKNTTRFFAWSLLLATTFLPITVQAATKEYTGAFDSTGGDAFTAPTNWVGGVPANSIVTDIASFNQTSYAFSTLNRATNFSLNGLIFGDGSTSTADISILIGGAAGQQLRLGTAGIVMNANSGNATINKIRADANQAWTNNSTSLLSIGTLTNANVTPFTTTLGGSGRIAITGVVSDGGAVGTTALIISGANATLSGANTFTGGLTLNSGTLNLGNNAALGAATNVFTINGGTVDVTAARTTTNNNAQNWNGDFTFGGTNTWNTGTGAVTMNASRTVTVSASTMTVGGVISGGGFSLTKNGSGALTLSSNNTYSGGTIVNAGTVRVGADAALGTGILTLNEGSKLTSALNTTATYAVANDITVGGNFTLGETNFTGPLNLSGNVSLGSVDRTITVVNVAGNGNYWSSMLGAITGTGGIIKEGTGGLQLNNANSTFSGNVTINGGTLAVRDTASIGGSAKTITINEGATLSSYGAQALSLSNAIVIGGNFTLLGANSMTLSGPMNIGAADRTLTVSNTGNKTISGNIVGSGGLIVGDDFAASTTTPTLKLTGNNTFGGNLTLLNTVFVSVNRTEALGNGSEINLSQNSMLVTTGNIATTKTINLNISGGTSAQLYQNASTTLTVNGTVTGGNAMEKGGAGTLTLNGANAFTGGSFLVSAGKLNLGNASAMNGTTLRFNGAVSLDNTTGATLTNPTGMQGVAMTSGFTFVGTNALDLSGIDTGFMQTVGGNRTITVTANTLTMNGITTTGNFTNGTAKVDGSLIKGGAGTLVIAGASDYTLGTTVGAGILQANHASALGASGNITFTGGVLQYTANSSATDYSTRFKNSTSAIYLDNNNETVTLAGLIDSTNTGGFTKAVGTGGNSIVISNTGNTFTGTLTIERGNLEVASLADSGAGSNGDGAIKMGFGAQTGTLVYNGSGATLTRAIELSGTQGGGRIDQSGTGLLKFTSDLTFTTSSAQNKLFTLMGSNLAGTGEFAGVIGNNSGGGITSLTKSGTGTWTVSNNNTYTGATTVSGGTLQVGNGGTTGAINTASAISNNATLAFNRNNTVTQGTDFANAINGTGKLEQNGTGNLILAAGNTYSGNTTVNGGGTGSITIGDDSALGAAPGAATADHLVLNNGGLVTTGTFVLAAERGILLAGSGGQLNTANGTTLTYNGTIAGSALQKAGLGILNLGGANSYTGGTAVSEGTLLVNGSLSTGSVVVATGATLGGSGTIGGATTIDGALNPGNSPGIISFSDALTLNGTTTMEINGTTRGTDYDGINTVGLLTYGGALTLNFGAATADGNLYDLFNIGAGSYTGTFDSVNLIGTYTDTLVNSSGVWSVTNSGFIFTFTEATGNLGIAAVPEPAAWILAAFGLTTAVVFRRRRQE